MSVESKGDSIVITIKPNGGGQLSKSGKSEVVASTHGNIPLAHKGETMYLGLNLYKRV
jgi:hypothetical protein